MSTHDVNRNRRRLVLAASAGIVGALGAENAVTRVMFANPPGETKPISHEPVEVDLSKLEPGQLITVEWRGRLVWVLRRTENNITDLPGLNEMLIDPYSAVDKQPAYAKNPHRSLRPEVAVLLGICTHLGCSPDYRPDMAPEDIGPYWKGGFLCPCHGSRYDLAGRVFMGSPAPGNLEVPPYRFLNDTRILVGENPADS